MELALSFIYVFVVIASVVYVGINERTVTNLQVLGLAIINGTFGIFTTMELSSGQGFWLGLINVGSLGLSVICAVLVIVAGCDYIDNGER